MKLSHSIDLTGLGVHTGIPSQVSLRLRPEAIGEPRFHLPGFTLPVSPKDLADLGRKVSRSTLLEGSNATVRTPEHLLAALLFFPGWPVDIELTGPEFPVLDGSALPYLHALRELGSSRSDLPEPGWREYPSNLEWDHNWTSKDGFSGFIRVRPAARFRVRYELEYPPLKETYELVDPESALWEVLPARTFILHHQFQEAKQTGILLQGANAGSGLLLSETSQEHEHILMDHPEWAGNLFPLLNEQTWRMEAEPVKHKVLDLLGDLAILGLRLPKVSVEIRNGGHSVHHLLLDKLRSGEGID